MQDLNPTASYHCCRKKNSIHCRFMSKTVESEKKVKVTSSVHSKNLQKFTTNEHDSFQSRILNLKEKNSPITSNQVYFD